MELDTTAIIIATIAVIPGLYAAISTLKKDRLDVGKLALQMCEQLDQKVKDLEKQIQESEVIIAALQENNLELKNEIGLVKLENATLKGELDKVKLENEELKKEVAQLRTENVELKEENQDLRDRLDVVEQRRSKPGSAK